MMCQRIGLPPISTIGFGLTAVSSESLVPSPPARMTAFWGVHARPQIVGAEIVAAAALEVAEQRHAICGTARQHHAHDLRAAGARVAEQGMVARRSSSETSASSVAYVAECVAISASVASRSRAGGAIRRPVEGAGDAGTRELRAIDFTAQMEQDVRLVLQRGYAFGLGQDHQVLQR